VNNFENIYRQYGNGEFYYVYSDTDPNEKTTKLYTLESNRSANPYKSFDTDRFVEYATFTTKQIDTVNDDELLLSYSINTENLHYIQNMINNGKFDIINNYESLINMAIKYKKFDIINKIVGMLINEQNNKHNDEMAVCKFFNPKEDMAKTLKIYNPNSMDYEPRSRDYGQEVVFFIWLLFVGAMIYYGAMVISYLHF
jgi:hypothetical protein